MSAIDTEYFDDIINSIESIPTCQALTDYVQPLIEDMEQQLTDMADTITALPNAADLAILSTTPTTLPEQIAWTAVYIKYNVVPIVDQITAIQDEITTYTTQITRIINAATEKASQIPNCSLPPLP
jgi:prefoldin subunit 5